MDKSITYIDKPLQVLVQIGQVVLALLILCYLGLFALQQLLSRLLQLFPFSVFVVDARNHEFVLVGLVVFGMESQELLDGD